VVTTGDVVAYLQSACRAGLESALEKQSVSQALDESGRQALAEAARKSAASAAFAAGIELLPPFHVDAESETLKRERLAAMQRELAERNAAGQVAHFQKAAELLKQFETLRRTSPDLSPGRLLQQVGAADQGSMLQTLLLASADAGRRRELWAAAGDSLVSVDARSESPRTHRLTLPKDLGPLRSVQPGERGADQPTAILAGAQGGVWLVPDGGRGRPTAYVDSEIGSQRGFTRALLWGERGIVACHGEGGLVRWDRDKPETPTDVIRPSQLAAMAGTSDELAPRNVQAWDEAHLVFSAGSRTFLTDLRTVTALPSASNGEVVAIVMEGGRAYLVHHDGVICGVDRATRQIACKEERGLRVNAAGGVPWLGTQRLLLAGDEGVVQCVGFDDPLATQYVGPYDGLRRVGGSAEFVAAVSGDRQRLVFWRSWDGRKPLGEVYITGLTRHRIADIDFI
jgi:hypothetical protein